MDRFPLFYRDPQKVLDALEGGRFVTAVKETLLRLPTSESFQESHFGEILASIAAEELLGWRLLYSKLTLQTAENQNPFKIDLFLYDPSETPVVFILGSVKASPKENSPANHSSSCYSDLIRSLGSYSEEDLEFDLAAAKDRLSVRPAVEQERVRAALLSYGKIPLRYAGFAVIDLITRDDADMTLLAERKSPKAFDVEVMCVEGYRSVSKEVYARIAAIKEACSL